VGRLEDSAFTLLGSTGCTHGVVEVGELFEHTTEDPSDDVRHPVGCLSIEFLGHSLHGVSHRGFDRLDRVNE
jgi:hypothetical protein